MANKNKKHITVTSNDNDQTIRLENPNLKIVSKQGEQISVHNFFELFSTVEKTKRIKKQLDKDIKMLKQIKLSFQKKLKKFKTAKLLSVRKLKERESYLLNHYEEIVTKMKVQAEQEITKQFSEFKQEIVAEKDKIYEEIDSTTTKSIKSITSEGNKFTKTLNSSEFNITEQLTKIKTEIKAEKDKITSEIKTSTKESISEITTEGSKFTATLNNAEANIEERTEDKLTSLEQTITKLKEDALSDIETTKTEIIDEIEDVGTTKEKFKKFTKISQDYIKESIDNALEEIRSIRETMSTEINTLNSSTTKEIAELQASTKEQSQEMITELKELKLNLVKDIDELKKTTSSELSAISRQSKQESTDTLKTILNNLEDFSTKTKSEIKDLTERFEAEQDTMTKNTYKDLQRIQAKLEEIDKTEDIRAITEHFKELKKEQDLTIEDVKFSAKQAHAQSIDELLTKVQEIKVANKEELNLVKTNISEHENMFYEKVQKNLDELLEISKLESDKQLAETSNTIKILKEDTATEINNIRSELKEEKLQMVEEALRDLAELKDDINNKAEQQVAEAARMLQDFKQSFEYAQKQLINANEDKYQEFEAEINIKLQGQLESAKSYIEDIKGDSLKRVHEITRDVETEQKILNKLIVQVKGIKTTLETGVFANLDSTLDNIESIKSTHTLEMENLKKENNRTQQETVRQLKELVENSIESHLENALTRIDQLQKQLKDEKNELTESTIKINRLQSQTQQEIYGQLEKTLSSVNTIKTEAESSIKKLKSESFSEILNLKKGLHQVINYLKKQKTKDEKKMLSTETIITKKNSNTSTAADELISMLLKDDLSKN